MYIFKNGDACPCCGKPLEGMSNESLALFSKLCLVAGLIDNDRVGFEIHDIDTGIFPPPDAGIYPPVKPITLS